MKTKFIVPANILFAPVESNNIVKEYLKRNYVNGKSYLTWLSKFGGNYIIRNKDNGKAYNGSTKNLYYRLFSLGFSSSWRVNISRHDQISWIKLKNLDDFEVIIYPSEDNKELRFEKEYRLRRLYKLNKPEFGFNICLKSSGCNGTGGHRWVTNGDIDLLIKINDDTPDGFFPGQKKQSWVKNFFLKYNWDWRLRDKNSDQIIFKIKDKRELLDCTIATTLRNGARYIHSLIKNLDELYNIKVIIG